MICAIHQPDFLPYLGYFYKMSKADVFVFLDDAQYSKGDRHEYNEIVSPMGNRIRLKVPIEYRFPCPMTEVKVKGMEWLVKQYDSLHRCYGMNDELERMQGRIVKIAEHSSSLAEMNCIINSMIARKFGFATRLCRSSTFYLKSRSNQRLIDICKIVGADTYLSGTGAHAYLDEDLFGKNGIKVVYSDYDPVPYKQMAKGFSGYFVPNLSVIDFIATNGFCFEQYYGGR